MPRRFTDERVLTLVPGGWAFTDDVTAWNGAAGLLSDGAEG